MQTMIELEGLSKRYAGTLLKKGSLALTDVSLSVNAGEAFGFIGPNGAGKSTTMKILTGVISATSGSARVMGADVRDPHSRLGLGYVPENPYLSDSLTPLEILQMGCAIHKLPAEGLKAHCMQWLDRFGIASVARKRIRSFSKGMTQRVALAHALAVKPRMLILDEPLSGLDPIGRKEVVDILLEYREQGGTIFFSSHILNDVERLADRFGVIHKGRLRAVKNAAELVSQAQRFIVSVSGTKPFANAQAVSQAVWQVCVPQSEIPAVMAFVLETGQELRQIVPEITLESAFLQYVNED